MGALADLRAQVVAALGTIPEVVAEDWTVHPAPIDAISPPAYFLEWDRDRSSAALTFCQRTGFLQVVAIAARIEPDPGYELLESMLEAAWTAFAVARIPAGDTSGFGPLDVGGIKYLSAQISITAPLTFGE